MSKLQIIITDYLLPALAAFILLVFGIEIVLMAFDVIKLGLA